MRKTLFLFLLVLLPTICYSQYKSDFMIADSAALPFFDFDDKNNVHMVWANRQERDLGVKYAAFDSIGNVVYQMRRISKTIFAWDQKLAINKNLVACVWNDRVAWDITFFTTYIKGKILKDGLDYSNELYIDDGDYIANDAHRYHPDIIWHNDSILYSVWAGDGSRSFVTDGPDIYSQKILFPPLRKSFPINYVLNNSWLKIEEILPTVIRQSSGTGYLAIWVEKDSLSILKIAGVTCDDSLKPVSSKIVFVNFDSVKYYMSKPAIFHRRNGNIIIAWEKDTVNFQANIYFQEFTEQGTPVSEVKKVNEKPASGTSSTVADIDPDGRFIIVWEDVTDLMAQRYNSDMNKIGTNFKLNTLQTNGDYFPCVKLRNGKIYSAWTRSSNGGPSVWMNILDFDNPTLSVTDENLVIKDYALEQNYPNPFNPATTINYQIPKDGYVALKIYDALGREVKTLVNEFKSSGRYTVIFDASKLSSGMYIYKLVSEKYSAVKKMILVK